ncbi:MAG: HAD family hydrolase [Acidobacteriota bacterium]
MKLLLFDIDGTLIRAGRQVGPIFLGALEETFGRPVQFGNYSFAGRTDSQIIFELMARSGVSHQEIEATLPEMRDCYLERLERDLDPRQMTICPGVVPLLQRLSQRDDVALGLLTGNFRRGAYIKLERLGLDEYFPIGAFGDDGIDRSELPPIALQRARSTYRHPFDSANTVIIGDTPNDIRCARDHGMAVYAVATGTYPLAQLETGGATWTYADLEPLEQALGLRDQVGSSIRSSSSGNSGSSENSGDSNLPSVPT